MSQDTERNQIATTIATVTNAIDWDNIDLQAVIDAANQGRLGKELTRWLASRGWNLGKFVARDKFVVNTGPKAQVKVSYLGDNFRAWFLPAVEDNPAVATLEHFLLEAAMFDKDIIAKIGGVAKAITSLAEIFGKMEAQPNGPKSPAGDLLTNGSANIFYVPQAVKKLTDRSFSYVSSDGQEVTEKLEDSQYLFQVGDQWFVLRAVLVSWRVDGWGVGAGSVGHPSEWGAGGLVFSRNSVLKSSEPVVAATS